MADEDIQVVKLFTVDLYVDQLPGYPEDLHPYPENYTIYLDSEDYNPVDKVIAELTGSGG